MQTKRNILLVVIAVIVAVGAFILLSGGRIKDVGANRQVSNMNAKIETFPDSRISLLGRGAPGFDELLRTKPVPSDLQDDLADFSVFLVNNSDQLIVGYNVRWEIGRPGGVPITQTISFIDDAWLGTPTHTTGKGMVAPGSSRFVSILQAAQGFWAQSNAPSVEAQREAEIKTRASVVKRVHNLRNMLKRAGDWRVAIDGVILSNGRFIGQNKGRFFEATKAKAEADRDFYRNLVAGLDGGLSLDTLLRVAVTDTKAARDALMSEQSLTPEGFYKRRQEGLAESLTGLRSQVSEGELTKIVRAENRKARAVIQK